MDRDFDSDNHNFYNHFLTLVRSNILHYFVNQNMDQGYMLQPFLNGNPNFKEEIFQYLIAEFIKGRLNNFEANQRLFDSDTSEHDVQTNYDNHMTNNTQPMQRTTSQLKSDKLIDKNKQLDQNTVTIPNKQKNVNLI